jgi:hypothetical protein
MPPLPEYQAHRVYRANSPLDARLAPERIGTMRCGSETDRPNCTEQFNSHECARRKASFLGSTAGGASRAGTSPKCACSSRQAGPQTCVPVRVRIDRELAKHAPRIHEPAPRPRSGAASQPRPSPFPAPPPRPRSCPAPLTPRRQHGSHAKVRRTSSVTNSQRASMPSRS